MMASKSIIVVTCALMVVSCNRRENAPVVYPTEQGRKFENLMSASSCGKLFQTLKREYAYACKAENMSVNMKSVSVGIFKANNDKPETEPIFERHCGPVKVDDGTILFGGLFENEDKIDFEAICRVVEQRLSASPEPPA